MRLTPPLNPVVVDPLPSRAGLPALRRPAPIGRASFVPYVMTGCFWHPYGMKGHGWRGGTRAAGGARCLVMGCGAAVAGIAEVSCEVPRRPLLLAANSSRNALREAKEGSAPLCSPQHWAPPRAGWVMLSGWQTRREASFCFSFPARWLKPSLRS